MASTSDPRKRPLTTALEGAAPVAPMAPSKQTASYQDHVTALSDLMNAFITLAKLDLTLDRAREDLSSASIEYNNLLPQFASFPAIKEQKTRAKHLAEKKVSELEARMKQERTSSTHVMSGFAALIGRQSQMQAAAPALTQEEKTQISRVQAIEKLATRLEQRVNALETQIQPNASVALSSDRVELEQLTSRLDAIEEDITKTQNDIFDTVENNLNVALEANNKAIAAEFKADLDVLRQGFNDGNQVQHQNALAVNSCVDRLNKMEAVQGRLALSESLSEVSQTVTTLEERVRAIETKNRSSKPREEAASSGFRPVIYSSGSESDDGADPYMLQADGSKVRNPKGMQLVKGDIERLKHIVRQQERQINNLTTDDVVHQMLDQFSRTFPQAQNFEATTSRLGSAVEAVNGRVDVHDKAVGDGQASIAKLAADTQQIHASIKQLFSSVDRLDTTISKLNHDD